MHDPPSTEAARATIKEIMARAEFHPAPDFLDQLRAWFDDLLRALLGGAVRSGLALPPAWVLLPIFTILIVYLLLRLLPAIGSGKKAAPRRPVTLSEVLEGQATSKEQALELARKALQDGNVRRALWIGHRLLLADLDGRSQIVFLPSKTNTQYLKECKDPLLASFTGMYEEVVYAQRPARPEEAARLLESLK